MRLTLISAIACTFLRSKVGAVRRSEKSGKSPQPDLEDNSQLPADQVPSFADTEEAKLARVKLVKDALATEAGPVVQMLLGDAIGDAWGFHVEMEDTYWLQWNVNFSSGNLSASGHIKTWPSRRKAPGYWDDRMIGMYSDDAEMTVALANGLMEYGKDINSDQMLEFWRREWDLSAQRPPSANAGYDYKTMQANGTRRIGHGSIRNHWSGKKTLAEVRDYQKTKEDPGNAPPMRSLPLTFFASEDRERLATANAEATHPHLKARAASFLVATASRFLMQGGKQQHVIYESLNSLRATKSLQEPETNEYLKKVDELPDWHKYGENMKEMPASVLNLLVGPQPRSVKAKEQIVKFGLNSDAMRTVGVVLYTLKWHHGVWDAFTPAIYIGGDIDSTAALVGGVIGLSAGLRLGELGGVPWWVIEKLEGVEYMVARGKLFHAWLRKNKFLSATKWFKKPLKWLRKKVKAGGGTAE